MNYINIHSDNASIEIELQNFIFIFPDNIKFEIFNIPGSYSGFNICDQKYEYELIDGLMGLRLLITSVDPNTTDTRDLPFHDGTKHFLPDFVKCTQWDNK